MRYNAKPGTRTRLRFCTPPQSFKNILKELDSDFSDAIKLMGFKKVYFFHHAIIAERSRQGVGTGHESSNFAASHYLT